MRKTINSFLTTFALISRIPVRTTVSPEYRFTVFLMPVIGIFGAVLVSLAGFGGVYFFHDAFLAAVVALVLQYAAFNLFHFDGLLDSADALATFGDREKRLAILNDVNVGSFALFCGVVYLLTKVYLLYRGLQYLRDLPGGLADNLGLLAVLASYCVSGRAAGAFLPTLLKPARTGGLGALLSGSSFASALFGTVTALAIVSVPHLLTIPSGLDVLFLIPAIAGITLSAVFSGVLYKKKIGGYTGDAIGLAIEIGELAHLFLFVLIAGYIQ